MMQHPSSAVIRARSTARSQVAEAGRHSRTGRRTARALLGAAVLMLAAVSGQRTALAADGTPLWDWEGVVVGSGRPYALASNQNGGAIVAWRSGSGIRVQNVSAGGVELWTTGGVQLATTGENPQVFTEWGIFGMLTTVVWEEAPGSGTGVRIQRLNASGVPQWTAGGVQVATVGDYPRVIHAAGTTWFDPPGAFIAYVGPGVAVRLAHVNGSGTVSGDIQLGFVRELGPEFFQMVPDGAGGAIVAWATPPPKNIVAQRVNAGVQWGSGGVVVSSDFRDEGPLDMASDGAGGALISWTAQYPYPASGQIRVQRLNASGTSLWTTNGVVVVDSAVVGGDLNRWWQSELTSAVDSDGSGGAVVAWNDWRNDPPVGNDDVYAQRFSSTGNPLWTTNGVLLPPWIVGSTAPGSQRAPQIVGDGTGGAVVTYHDKGGNSWDISATRVNASGGKNWSQYVYTDFNQDDDDQEFPLIVFDESGPSPQGAVIAWFDDGPNEVRLQKIEISSTPANLIFADGFESGDTSAWSNTVP